MRHEFCQLPRRVGGAACPLCRDPSRMGLGPEWKFLFAGTLLASSIAHDQFNALELLKRTSDTKWNVCEISASRQRGRWRRKVMSPAQPISCGSIFRNMPLRRAEMIPSRHTRSGNCHRPPFGVGSSGESCSKRWPRACHSQPPSKASPAAAPASARVAAIAIRTAWPPRPLHLLHQVHVVANGLVSRLNCVSCRCF